LGVLRLISISKFENILALNDAAWWFKSCQITQEHDY